MITSSKDKCQRVNSSSDESSPQERVDGDVGDSREDDHALLSIKKAHSSCENSINGRQGRSRVTTDADAMLALQRAIQSSPGHTSGSKHSPIELDNLTPKPTRRILFPSPRSSSQTTPLSEKDINLGLGSQDSSPRRSRRLQNVMSRSRSDKENLPPQTNNEFDDLFDEAAKRGSPKASPSESNPFVTPTKKQSTPKRSLNTGDFFSSAAKAFLDLPSTPKRSSPPHQAMGTLMTPFTAQLNRLLSDANGNMDSPSKFLDFSSLPSLEGATSPSRFLGSDTFGFEGFGGEGGLPSSPPTGWFGVYEDPGQKDWEMMGEVGETRMAKDVMMGLEEEGLKLKAEMDG